MARKVIGGKGSRRRRWLFLACLVVTVGVGGVFIAGAGAVTGSPSKFESGDGNMLLGTSGNTDWNCFQGSGGFPTGANYGPSGSGFTQASCAKHLGATQVWSDGGTTSVGTNELEFKGGTKFDDACTVIQGGNNPPKDEWSNIAEYTETSGTGDLWFYGASIRPVVNGNTSGNVYFSQRANGCRTVGDILLAFDFLNGGGTPSLHSLTWIDSPSTATSLANTCYLSSSQGGFCWGNKHDINTANYDGEVNVNPIAAADNGISRTPLAANAFAEFGINLTQALSPAPLPCFANQTWVSRSSGSSFGSQPEDVEVVQKPTCGSITIIKHTDPAGLNQKFGYTASGGSISPASFKLNDQSALTVRSISTGTTTSTITTTAANNFSVGDTVGVTISGSNSTPKVDGNYTATVTGATTFTIPLSAPVTTAGTAGSVKTNTELYSGLSANTYTVSEGATTNSGFTFESLNCVDSGGNSTPTPSDRTATITVVAGGSTVCTYVNQRNTATFTTQQSTTAAVFPGSSVTDTATVTGTPTTAGTPSGTVTFYLCGPLTSASGCSSSDTSRVSAGTGGLAVTTTAGQASATSSAVNSTSPLAKGIYCFEATWPGDDNYPYPGARDSTTATNECFTVVNPKTTLQVTDTLKGLGSGATGTVHYTAYKSLANCQSTPPAAVNGTTVVDLTPTVNTVSGDAAPTSKSIDVAPGDTVYFTATYSGNEGNLTTSCTAETASSS